LIAEHSFMVSRCVYRVCSCHCHATAAAAAAAAVAGEVFSWGINKDGRLGYGAVDSQPTPRK
jgi:alpha-tubulin suppressor-like RCC1 family protein